MRWCAGEDRSPRAFGPASPYRALPGGSLARDERPVLANEQVEVIAFLVGKLEKDSLALRFFESFTVLPEKAVRPALAPDSDAQRFLVVHSVAAQFFDPSGEQPIGSALEEEERRL